MKKQSPPLNVATNRLAFSASDSGGVESLASICGGWGGSLTSAGARGACSLAAPTGSVALSRAFSDGLLTAGGRLGALSGACGCGLCTASVAAPGGLSGLSPARRKALTISSTRLGGTPELEFAGPGCEGPALPSGVGLAPCPLSRSEASIEFAGASGTGALDGSGPRSFASRCPCGGLVGLCFGASGGKTDCFSPVAVCSLSGAGGGADATRA
jgi:hypothetical protein